MKKLVALFAALVLVSLPSTASAGKTALGTITLDTVDPHYGQNISFHWAFLKRPQYPTLGVFLNQNGKWVYIAELSVPRELTGSGSVLLTSETSSALPGTIDYNQPSAGQAYLWDERFGGNGPVVITSQVFFTIPAGLP